MKGTPVARNGIMVRSGACQDALCAFTEDKGTKRDMCLGRVWREWQRDGATGDSCRVNINAWSAAGALILSGGRRWQRRRDARSDLAGMATRDRPHFARKVHEKAVIEKVCLPMVPDSLIAEALFRGIFDCLLYYVVLFPIYHLVQSLHHRFWSSFPLAFKR